jgi:hypothetical protein
MVSSICGTTTTAAAAAAAAAVGAGCCRGATADCVGLSAAHTEEGVQRRAQGGALRCTHGRGGSASSSGWGSPLHTRKRGFSVELRVGLSGQGRSRASWVVRPKERRMRRLAE